MYIAIQNRCKGNLSLVQEAVRLKLELAKLLGFPNYAAVQLQSRMAKTPDRVNEFLADLRSKLIPHGLASLRMLQDFKKSDLESGENDNEFFLWDYKFYRNKMLKSRLPIDKSRIKEYFPLQTTTTAVLNLLAQLFGLVFDEIKANDSMVWHTDVQLFAVHNDQVGVTFSVIYILTSFNETASIHRRHISIYNRSVYFASEERGRNGPVQYDYFII